MAKILVGISGSIAAYKSVMWLRELSKLGHVCRVILTTGGAKFVTPELIAGLGFEVYVAGGVNLTDTDQAMLHIELAKWADLFIIAPASANTIARLASGLADDLLGEAALAYPQATIYLAPAMNQQMWNNSLVQSNLQRLQQHGYQIWEPESGVQACGDIGYGRLPEPEHLLALTLAQLELQLAANVLAGKKIVITLGSGVEVIDPVRYLANHSSGKMGVALVIAALKLGAEVVAIHGRLSGCQLPHHPRLHSIAAAAAEAMLEHSLSAAATADVVIGCAAVCDYRVAAPAPHKLKRTKHELTLQLTPNPDIIATVKQRFHSCMVVGFAAETEKLIEHAQAKLASKCLDLVVANDVSQGQVFGAEQTQFSLVGRGGEVTSFALMSKQQAAEQILTKIVELLRQ